jgi:hypothetical protein
MLKRFDDTVFDGTKLAANLLTRQLQTAVEDEIEVSRGYAVGWIDYYNGICGFKARIVKQYGMQVTDVCGDSDSFYLTIEVSGYIKKFLEKYKIDEKIVLEIYNTTGDGWNTYEDIAQFSDAIGELRFEEDYLLRVDAWEFIQDFCEAAFLQKLGG